MTGQWQPLWFAVNGAEVRIGDDVLVDVAPRGSLAEELATGRVLSASGGHGLPEILLRSGRIVTVYPLKIQHRTR